MSRPPKRHHRQSPTIIFLVLFLFSTLLAPTCSQSAPAEPQSTPFPTIKDLHCCVMMQYPNVFKSPMKSRKLEGMAINYLESLEELLGFRCKVLDLVPNVRFTGFILEMNKCSQNASEPGNPICKCELGVGGWMLNQQRLGKVQYLPPFVRDDIRVVVHVDNVFRNSSGPFFLTTFTPSVWGAIVGLVICWSILKMLDRRFVPPDHNSFTPLSRDAHSLARRVRHGLLKSTFWRRLRKSFQSTVGRMIGHVDESTESVLPSTRQWILNFIILLCGLFFVLIYEATMTANLVQESVQSDFRSIDDFKSCVIKPEDVCVTLGGAVNAFWNSTTGMEECHQGRSPVWAPSYEEAIEMVANKTCKFLLVDGSTARYATDVRFCRHLMTTGNPVYPATNSFVVPNGASYFETLANATLKLLEGGRLESLEDFFERRGGCVLPESTTITFSKLRIFFIAAYAITIILFFEMVLDPQQPSQSLDRQAGKQPPTPPISEHQHHLQMPPQPPQPTPSLQSSQPPFIPPPTVPQQQQQPQPQQTSVIPHNDRIDPTKDTMEEEEEDKEDDNFERR